MRFPDPAGLRTFSRFLIVTGVVLGLSWALPPAWRPSALWGKPTTLETTTLRDAPIVRTRPIQEPVANASPVTINGYTVTPLARFTLTALVLSRADYRLDRESDLSPTDLALGWGPMSVPDNIARIHISQGRRFYFWRHRPGSRLTNRDVILNSSNIHIIPADESVRRALSTVRRGQVVHLDGKLVEARAPDGWTWMSSLVRTDTGKGACELFLVENIHID